MMKLKAKAWDVFNKEWIHDPIIDGKTGMMMGFSLLDGSFQRHFSKDEVKLSVCTGLKDANGKDIYAGDVIRYNNNDYMRTGGILDDEIVIGVVKYGDGFFAINDDVLINVLVNDEQAMVIGNIFENPELMESDKND